jgi:hypothetical protein
VKIGFRQMGDAMGTNRAFVFKEQVSTPFANPGKKKADEIPDVDHEFKNRDFW